MDPTLINRAPVCQGPVAQNFDLRLPQSYEKNLCMSKAHTEVPTAGLQFTNLNN